MAFLTAALSNSPSNHEAPKTSCLKHFYYLFLVFQEIERNDPLYQKLTASD